MFSKEHARARPLLLPSISTHNVPDAITFNKSRRSTIVENKPRVTPSSSAPSSTRRFILHPKTVPFSTVARVNYKNDYFRVINDADHFPSATHGIDRAPHTGGGESRFSYTVVLRSARARGKTARRIRRQPDASPIFVFKRSVRYERRSSMLLITFEDPVRV